ncbi:MAG: hypothetical protein KDB99_03590 [Chitinophagaceae bacterium]|nr:hypothetical protein [Chitinophagaceae bacterium]
MKTVKIIYSILFIFLLASCSPTKITKTWVDKSIGPRKYNRVLVLCVIPETEKELGLKMENQLTGDLTDLGYDAIAANKIFPEGTFVRGDTARAVAALAGKGFDGIMTIVLIDKKKQPYYVPGKVNEKLAFDKLNGFNRYYITVADHIYSPGYYGEEIKYVWENNFYDLIDNKIVYSARSRTLDITSVNQLAHQYGLLMAQSLVNNDILAKPN